MLKYGDKVKVTSGFYEGMIGTLIDYEQSDAAGAGVVFYPSYTVSFYTTNGEVLFNRLFSEKYLQKIEG